MTRFARRLVLAVILLATVVTLTRARAAPGDTCDPARRVCVDKATGLACEADGPLAPKLKAVSCRGPRGCTGENVTYDCDHRAALAGDGCATAHELACTTDGDAVLVCGPDHVFTLRATCPGPARCSLRDGWVSCDDSMASEGDACVQPKAIACASQGSGVLMCSSDHRFAPYATCRGPRGCALEDGRVTCDDSIADAGDPCARAGEVACGLDGREVLVCKSAPGFTVAEGAFVLSHSCPGPKGCVAKADAVECDGAPAQAGDPCGQRGALACTPDGDSAVECSKDGHFQTWARCRGEGRCEDHGDSVTCDASVAEVGDACSSPGDRVCEPDNLKAVRCGTDHVFAPYAACLGPMGCEGHGTSLACDESFAQPGARCTNEGQVTCGVSGKAAFVCKGGVSVSLGDCPNGCKLMSDDLECFGGTVHVGDACIDRQQDAKAGRAWLTCKSGRFVVGIANEYSSDDSSWWLMRSSGRLPRLRQSTR